jgi:hypothetical protein
MAAGIMEIDGTLRSVVTAGKSAAETPKSVSFLKLWNVDASASKCSVKFCVAVDTNFSAGYAISSGCNKTELSTELARAPLHSVSFLKQQLRRCAEVSLPSSANLSQPSPASLPEMARAVAAAPQVTEFRRERGNPAGRLSRSFENRAARRAGSQG